MKRKFLWMVVAASALVFIACSGLPGKFIGKGWLPSMDDPEGSIATFHFVLNAQDKEPDEEGFADTFSGWIRYADEAAGVDVYGKVADGREEGFSEDEIGGVYYDDVYGDYGAFGGFWTGQVPFDDDLVTEGIFVVRVKDVTVEGGGDGIRIELFDLEADIFSDTPIYSNEDYIDGGDIRYRAVKEKKPKKEK